MEDIIPLSSDASEYDTVSFMDQDFPIVPLQRFDFGSADAVLVSGVTDDAGKTLIRAVEAGIPVLDFTAQVIRYHYYMLTEEYDRAKQVLEEVEADQSTQTRDIMTRYTMQADYALFKGDRETAREAMARAEKCCLEGTPILREIYDCWMKRFGFSEG